MNLVSTKADVDANIETLRRYLKAIGRTASLLKSEFGLALVSLQSKRTVGDSLGRADFSDIGRILVTLTWKTPTKTAA